INLAIQEQGGDKIKELQFIRQVVTSLPDSWDTLVSILDFDFDNMADAGGLQMSKKVQNKLLAEDMRRKAKSGDSAFFASTSQNRHFSGNRPFNQNRTDNARASDQAKVHCNNCHKPGHIAPDCRQPGGGAWKRNSRNPRDRNGQSGQNRPNNNKNRFQNNNKGKNRAYNA